MTENEICDIIFECALKVHRTLGPGLLESVYEKCLAIELKAAGLKVVRQMRVPIVYNGVALDEGYRIDLMVEDSVVVELKAISEILEIHRAQLITYLRLTDKKLGVLINFNTVLLKNGFKRVINGYF
ncbi:MAG: GxxExxY protein [Chitinophagaceae bacterium]|uniref:GxxExxY protein n=1 Tax=unclassified Paraflavitalea TaxID=2798305 RepID=UPI003D35221E|nr:GxxExxY protein [Chitinophagaceae bacterium]